MTHQDYRNLVSEMLNFYVANSTPDSNNRRKNARVWNTTQAEKTFSIEADKFLQVVTAEPSDETAIAVMRYVLHDTELGYAVIWPHLPTFPKIANKLYGKLAEIDRQEKKNPKENYWPVLS